MSQEQERKAALKALKQQRAEAIKAAAAVSKQQRKDMGLIKDRLAQGPATPPQVARDTGLPPKQTMWYLAAMRKYGQVAEAGKDGDFFNYQLVSEEPAAC